jgi:hypothetical protein
MVAAWLVVAAATAGVGTAALSMVGAGILGSSGPTLSDHDVALALDASAATTASSAPDPTVITPTGSAPRGLSTPAGSIVARCASGQVDLLSWSPAQGYGAADVSRGPAAAASVTFTSGETQTIATVTCQAGQPVATSRTVSSSRGGSRGGRGQH